MAILKTSDGTKIDMRSGESVHFLFYGIKEADLVKTFLENIKSRNQEAKYIL
jgi:hypothetical protein